jgi:putative Mg2+ transporter-C (MgtC) family protein
MRFSDEAVLRMVVAVVLGAVVGAEREVTEQPAGLRTHIAVCLGAAVFGVVSTLGFSEFEATRSTTNVQIDVTRVASQVVVGIGFLGAGMIFRERTIVRNLTTAASLWVVSAIGLLAGVGDLGTAAATTVILVLVLVALRPLRTALRERAQRPTRDLQIRLGLGADVSRAVEELRSIEGVEVTRLRVGKADGAATVSFRIEGQIGQDLEPLIARMVSRSDVTHLEPTAQGHDD